MRHSSVPRRTRSRPFVLGRQAGRDTPGLPASAREVPALRRPSARTYLTRRGEFVTVIAADSRGSRLVPAADGYKSRASGFTAHLPSSLGQPVELKRGREWI